MATNDGTMDFVTDQDLNLTASPYGNSLEQVAPGITGLVDQTQGVGETWYESLTRLLPVMAATYQQKQILQIQVDRARQGLPPLNSSQYSAGVQVGVSDDTKQLLIYGGIAALAALFLLSRKRR